MYVAVGPICFNKVAVIHCVVIDKCDMVIVIAYIVYNIVNVVATSISILQQL